MLRIDTFLSLSPFLFSYSFPKKKRKKKMRREWERTPTPSKLKAKKNISEAGIKYAKISIRERVLGVWGGRLIVFIPSAFLSGPFSSFLIRENRKKKTRSLAKKTKIAIQKYFLRRGLFARTRSVHELFNPPSLISYRFRIYFLSSLSLSPSPFGKRNIRRRNTGKVSVTWY